MRFTPIWVALSFTLCSCSVEDGSEQDDKVFSPMNLTEKMIYFRTVYFSSPFNTTIDSGYRKIGVESVTGDKDSLIFEVAVVDSVYSHKFTDHQVPSRNSNEPFVKRYKVWIVEKAKGTRTVRPEGFPDGNDRMLEFAFSEKYYPDSLISVEQYEGKSVEVVNRTSPEAKYVRNTGLVFFRDGTIIHPTSKWEYRLITNP